jgi:enoyl-[acyl-carrier-protein] reductase (NADH)
MLEAHHLRPVDHELHWKPQHLELENSIAELRYLYKSMSLLPFSDQTKRGSISAEQVAIMLFLLSQEASIITGPTYQIDGGFTIF